MLGKACVSLLMVYYEATESLRKIFLLKWSRQRVYKSAQKTIGLESYFSETLDCIQFKEARLVETVLGYDLNCPHLFVFSYL